MVGNHSFPFDETHWSDMQNRLTSSAPTLPWWKTWKITGSAIALLLVSNAILLYLLTQKEAPSTTIINTPIAYQDTLHIFEPVNIGYYEGKYSRRSSQNIAQASATASLSENINHSFEARHNTFALAQRSSNVPDVMAKHAVAPVAANETLLVEQAMILPAHENTSVAENVSNSLPTDSTQAKEPTNEPLTIAPANTDTTPSDDVLDFNNTPDESEIAAIAAKADSGKIKQKANEKELKPSKAVATADSSRKRASMERRWTLNTLWANEKSNWSDAGNRYDKSSILGAKIMYQLTPKLSVESGILYSQGRSDDINNLKPNDPADSSHLWLPVKKTLLTRIVHQTHWQFPLNLQYQLLTYNKFELLANAGFWLRRSTLYTEDNYSYISKANPNDSTSAVYINTIKFETDAQRSWNLGSNIALGFAWQLSDRLRFQMSPYWQKTLGKNDKIRGQGFGLGISVGFKL